MSLKFDELPKIAQMRISTIVETTSIPRKEVMKKYREVFNLDFIASAKTEELRHTWASQKLHADLLARPPLTKHNIVPVGVDGINKFKDQDPSQTIFVYELDLDKLISVRVGKEALNIVKELTLGEYYEGVDMSKSDQGNFFIDDRTVLPEPSPYIGIEVEEDEEEFPESIDALLTDNLGIRVIQMKDFGNSRMISDRSPPGDDGRTFVINTDWVCIRNCMVINNRKIPVRDMDGVFKGQLNVTDSSIAQDITTKRGIIIPNRMTVWVAPRHLYSPYSVLNLWGTVEHRTWKQRDPNDRSKEIERQNFQMNAYYVFLIAEGPEEAK